MQLGNTQISIRERGLLEILDLSLHLCRAYWLPLLVALACGVLPFALLNFVLTGWMLDIEFYVEYPFGYVWVTTLLIVLQAPVATVFVSGFLGQAVFDELPRFSQVVRRVWRVYHRIFWCDWVLRGVLAGYLLVLFIPRQMSREYWIEALWLPLLVLVCLGIRSFRPFINEIIVLEQNPLRAQEAASITIGKRSAMLHDPMSGQAFGRTLVGGLFGFLLTVALIGGLLVVSGVFLHDWRQGYGMIGFCFPAAVWGVMGFLAVSRFLSYLDVRIRQEGWEVEVLVRAEADALENRMR